MKSFDEFLSNLSFEEILKEVNPESEEFHLTDSKNLSEIVAYSVSLNLKASLKLLEAYHKWISE